MELSRWRSDQRWLGQPAHAFTEPADTPAQNSSAARRQRVPLHHSAIMIGFPEPWSQSGMARGRSTAHVGRLDARGAASGRRARASMTSTENSYLHRAGRTDPAGLWWWPGVAGGGLLAERRLLASAPRRKVSPPSGPFARVRTVGKNREVGESPTRARHCDRGALSRVPLGCWPGKAGKSGDPAARGPA